MYSFSERYFLNENNYEEILLNQASYLLNIIDI